VLRSDLRGNGFDLYQVVRQGRRQCLFVRVRIVIFRENLGDDGRTFETNGEVTATT
jgi:hypothetical protein